MAAHVGGWIVAEATIVVDRMKEQEEETRDRRYKAVDRRRVIGGG